MKRTNAREYRHRIEIQSFTLDSNELGEAERVWAVAHRRWAKINPLSGVEVFGARQLQSQITHEIRMRWFPGVDEAMRIVFKTRVFEIKSVINDEERNLEMIVLCKESPT